MLRRDPAEMDAACEWLIRQLAQRHAADARADTNTSMAVAGTFRSPARAPPAACVDVLDQHLPWPADGDDVARLRTVSASASISAPPRRTRSTKTRRPGNSSRTGRPVSRGVVDAVGAQFDGAIRGQDPGVKSDRAGAELSLVLGAGRGEIHSDHLWAELRENDSRADGAEDVGDGVADRNGIGVGLRLGRAAAEPVDLVCRDADGRGNRLRAGIEPAA